MTPTVKKLEWEQHDSVAIIANTAFGPYMAEPSGDGNFRAWLPDDTRNARRILDGFDTLEEAKAAAQADFDQRILSSLTQQEAGVAEPVAWMHPEAGWVHHDRQQIAMHCRKDGPGPMPLYAAPPAPQPSLAATGPVDDSGMGWGDLLAGYQRICAEHGIEPTSRDVLDALARHDAKEPVKLPKPFCYTASLNLGPRPTLASYFQESIYTVPLYLKPQPSLAGEVSDAGIVRAMEQVPGVDHDDMVRAVQAYLGLEIEQ